MIVSHGVRLQYPHLKKKPLSVPSGHDPIKRKGIWKIRIQTSGFLHRLETSCKACQHARYTNSQFEDSLRVEMYIGIDKVVIMEITTRNNKDSSGKPKAGVDVLTLDESIRDRTSSTASS